jgi:hypothetical protein
MSALGSTPTTSDDQAGAAAEIDDQAGAAP